MLNFTKNNVAIICSNSAKSLAENFVTAYCFPIAGSIQLLEVNEEAGQYRLTGWIGESYHGEVENIRDFDRLPEWLDLQSYDWVQL